MLKDLIKVLKGELSSKQVKNLNRRCADHELTWAQQNETNLRLIATIREMDQHIWHISQKAPDWARIQPHIARLMEGMEARKQIENSRIQNLMVGEIVDAYNTDPKYLQGPSS